MKVFLLKDVVNVGMANQIVNVSEGYAVNFLIPKKLGVQITPENEKNYLGKVKHVEHKKEVIASKTSMLGERIKTLTLTLKKKMHNDGKLYGSVSSTEVAELLSTEGVAVGKSQIEFEKSIKEKGSFPVTVKLTAKLHAKFVLKVIGEDQKGAH
jgi:large subunit ribosomal protein L9